MDEYVSLHGTSPHAEPMVFIFRCQFYWFDNSSLVGFSYLLLTYQFYCQIGKSLYRLNPSFCNWDDIDDSQPYWMRDLIFYFQLAVNDCSHYVCCTFQVLESMDDDIVRPLGPAEHHASCCVWLCYTWTTCLNDSTVLLHRSGCLDNLVTWALPS